MVYKVVIQTTLTLIGVIMKEDYELLYYLGNAQEGYELQVDRDSFTAKTLVDLRAQIEAAGYSNFQLELLEEYTQ